MDSLTTVIQQCLNSFFKIHATSLKMSTLSNVGKLHQAVKDDDPKNTFLLIHKGADVNLVYQQETSFTRAMDGKYFNAADVIISSKQFDPNAKNQFDRSPLFMAVKVGHVDYVKRLLEMGARVNDADVRGNTPLSACTWEDNHETAEILIQHGADIDHSDISGQTTLFRACSNVSVKVVKLLLGHNCNVDKATNEKKTPLMAALPSYYNSHVAGKKISDMLQICELLIKSGCNVNSQDSTGKTPLHLAVESNDIHGMCLLAENGCELNIQDNQGFTPFQAAILPSRCLYELARYLLYYGADVTNKMQFPKGSTSPPISPLSLILNSKPQPDELERNWSRALLLRSLWKSVYPNSSFAKNYEHTDGSANGSASEERVPSFHESVEKEVLEWLNSCIPCSLQHQAILKVRGTLGSRNIIPKINQLPVAPGLRQCLGLGLSPDWIPLSQMCRLHLYIADTDNEKIREIIKSGADMNVSIDNKTPLALALEIGNIEAAKMILESNSQPRFSMVNASGDSALHVAAKHGRHELMDEILRVYSDLDCQNFRGLTPLQVAIYSGHFTIAAVLINKGAEVISDKDAEIPLLHLAAASGAVDVVRLFLERGVDPNTEDKFRNTPLHVAASKGFQYLQLEVRLPGLYEDGITESLDSIQMTLTGSMPKFTNKAAHFAQIIECLIQNGADLNRVNLQAQTPLQCAQHYKSTELLDILNAKCS